MFLWQGIDEFVAVAESESFTRASQRLHISTAQVSRQVKALEDRLAVKLFYRTTRRVSLTENGAVYYQHCRSLLDGLEEAESAVGELQQTLKGSIKLTAPVTYGEEYILPLINDFMLEYPQLSVSVRLTNQALDLIEGGFDLAIRLGNQMDDSLVARQLSKRHQLVCASPAYLKTYGQPYTLKELSHHQCLQGSVEQWRFNELGLDKSIKVKGRLTCNSGYALVDAALKGLGIVQLPSYYLQEHIKSGKLVSLLEQFKPDEEGIWAMTPPKRHTPLKVDRLIEFLHLGLG